jgi:hypothetical protein
LIPEWIARGWTDIRRLHAATRWCSTYGAELSENIERKLRFSRDSIPPLWKRAWHLLSRSNIERNRLRTSDLYQLAQSLGQASLLDLDIRAGVDALTPHLEIEPPWSGGEGAGGPPEKLRDLYQLGSATRGYPLKLGLNSLYGKMAQRSGRGPYPDPVSAGLITAITRAKLIEAISQAPEAIVMVATDAVFSTRPLALDVGEGLGQWEEKIWPDLFIAQPGVYWSPTDLENSVKSRGAPRSVIGPAVSRFHKAFDDCLDVMRRPGAMSLMLQERLVPTVPVTVRVFYGHRLALARGKPWLAGKWEDVTRHESFEWRTKRHATRITLGDGYITTYPRVLSSPLQESEGYKPADFDRLVEIAGADGSAEIIDENMLLEAMPDHLQFLPHNE